MNILQRAKCAAAILFNRYEAAEWSPDRSWVPSDAQRADLDQRPETRQTLAGKIHHWEQSASLVQRLADLWEQRVVGAGIRFAVVSADEAWAEAAQARLAKWERDTDARAKQRLFARNYLVLGEAMLFRTRNGRNMPRVQVLEPAICETPEEQRRNPAFRDGIEYADGRPVRYWFRVDDRAEGERRWVGRDATWIEHRVRKRRSDQNRGISAFAPALNEIHDLRDLQQLEQQAARANGAVTNVVENDTGEAPPMGLTRTKFSADAERTVDPRAEFERYVKSVMGARTLFLRRGEKLNVHKSDRPTVASREYWRWLVEDVCSSCNVPIQLVYQESMSGPGTRLAIELANDSFENGFLDIVPAWRRVAVWVLESLAQTGQVPKPTAEWDLNPVVPKGLTIDREPEPAETAEDEDEEIDENDESRTENAEGNGSANRLILA